MALNPFRRLSLEGHVCFTEYQGVILGSNGRKDGLIKEVKGGFRWIEVAFVVQKRICYDERSSGVCHKKGELLC